VPWKFASHDHQGLEKAPQKESPPLVTGVNVLNYGRIQNGITFAQVKAILGEAKQLGGICASICRLSLGLWERDQVSILLTFDTNDGRGIVKEKFLEINGDPLTDYSR
jgi:hypothetical protein